MFILLKMLTCCVSKILIRYDQTLKTKEQLPNTLFAFSYKIRFGETEFPHPAKRHRDSVVKMYLCTSQRHRRYVSN